MFKTNPISLKTLLNNVDSGKIQLPDFQRGWVWDDNRIRGLLASISRGFPVGAIMTLEAGGEIQLKTRMIEGTEGTPGQHADAFLLDGQQRLTSLYQALLHEGPVDTHDDRGQRIKRWYYVDMLAAMAPNVDREDAIISVPEDRIETRNFGREIVHDLSSQEKEFQKHMMPTERLLDGMGWILEYNSYWAGREHPAGDLSAFLPKCQQLVLDPFVNYDLPVISLDKETPKEAVCTVFEKVNTGGVTLSVFELVTATFAAQDDNFSLREDWDKRRSRLQSDYGVLQGIGGDQFLQVVTLLTTQERYRAAIAEGHPQNRRPAINCRKNDILGLHVTDYQRWADRVEAGFVDAAKFLHRQFVFTQKDVPYTTQVVPLAALFVELGPDVEPAESNDLLERWYWSGIFGEIYGGAVETQYSLDLMQVPEWIRGGREPTVVSEANFIPERLLSLRTRQSAAYKGLYALQMKSGAADWISAQPLLFATWHNENVDIHHIFPKRWCERGASTKIPSSLYNSIINKTPIDAKTNRKIGAKAPSDYARLLELESKSGTGHLNQVLKSHWIEPELLRNDRFAECFVQRGEKMLELIGEAMGKSIPGGQIVFLNALASDGVVEVFDDPEDEHDAVGEQLYDDNSAATAGAGADSAV